LSTLCPKLLKSSETLKFLSEQVVYYPHMFKKDNTPYRNPSFRRFAHGSLVYSKTIADAVNLITCPYLPKLFTSTYPLTSFAS